MGCLPTLHDAGRNDGEKGTLGDASRKRGITRVIPGVTGHRIVRLGDVDQFRKSIRATSFEIGGWRGDRCQVSVRRKYVAAVSRLVGRAWLAGCNFPVRARGGNPRSIVTIGRHIESPVRTTGKRKRNKHKRNQRNRPAHTPPFLSASQIDASSNRRRPASIIGKNGEVLHSVGPWRGVGVSATAKRPARASS